MEKCQGYQSLDAAKRCGVEGVPYLQMRFFRERTTFTRNLGRVFGVLVSKTFFTSGTLRNVPLPAFKKQNVSTPAGPGTRARYPVNSACPLSLNGMFYHQIRFAYIREA